MCYLSALYAVLRARLSIDAKKPKVMFMYITDNNILLVA